MKHLAITILSAIIAIPASAQVVDSTAAVTGNKLNFEQPRFLVSDYFSSVKAHLSADGRKGWKPEFTLRANAELFDCSAILTGGIRTSQNKVFGLGVGWGARVFYFWPKFKSHRATYQHCCLSSTLYPSWAQKEFLPVQ